MVHSDIEANDFNLGTTSVRLIRVGSVVHLVFGKNLAARFYHDELIRRLGAKGVAAIPTGERSSEAGNHAIGTLAEHSFAALAAAATGMRERPSQAAQSRDS